MHNDVLQAVLCGCNCKFFKYIFMLGVHLKVLETMIYSFSPFNSYVLTSCFTNAQLTINHHHLKKL